MKVIRKECACGKERGLVSISYKSFGDFVDYTSLLISCFNKMQAFLIA